MTDFLSGLLDRVTERTPVLQRRRLSLFEPAPDMRAFGAIARERRPAHDEDDLVERSSIVESPPAPPPVSSSRRGSPASPRSRRRGFQDAGTAPDGRKARPDVAAPESEHEVRREARPDVIEPPQPRISRPARPAAGP